MLLFVYFFAIDDIQSFLQAADALALEVVDMPANILRLTTYLCYPRRLYFEFASEGLTAILHSDGIKTLGIG